MNNKLYHYKSSLLDALRDAEAAAMSIRSVAALALLNRPRRPLQRAACGDDTLIAQFEESCQDLLESLFLTNDSAHYCAAFQCSHTGESNATRIWILTPEQFPEWLKTHEIYWKSTPKF